MKSNNTSFLTDSALVSKVIAGDKAAFRIVIQKTERLVAQIVFKMIKQENEREDLSQDVYLKVYHKLNTFNFESKLSTWIAQIAFNTCKNHLTKKRINFLEIKDEIPSNVDYLADKNIEKKERTAIISNAINELPLIFQTLVVLFHQEELSYKEISEITGLPEGTIKSYLFRARAILKLNLKNIYNS